MTLKEQLEILRGEPIKEKAPIEAIPCIETSDAEKLCKHPVVSVNMITYNHEPYIRQAIEGVMMQKTDFEFELVIGEDASQDKTREICFEYQKKYPDKIRVLWSKQNVRAINNSTRVTTCCRGEFIAFCEGDDYWTDPLKLQKQVDIMRAYPDVGLCFCQATIYNEELKVIQPPLLSSHSFGKSLGQTFMSHYLFDAPQKKIKVGANHIMTATALVRVTALKECYKRYEIFKWNLLLGDKSMWLALASLSNVFYLQDVVSVYRQQRNGIMATASISVYRDGAIVSFFFMRQCGAKLLDGVKNCRYSYILTLILSSQPKLSPSQQRANYKLCYDMIEVKKVFSYCNNKIFKWLWKFGLLRQNMLPFFSKYLYFRTNTIKKIKLRYALKKGRKNECFNDDNKRLLARWY